jgi:hypothetical protein
LAIERHGSSVRSSSSRISEDLDMEEQKLGTNENSRADLPVDYDGNNPASGFTKAILKEKIKRETSNYKIIRQI